MSTGARVLACLIPVFTATAIPTDAAIIPFNDRALFLAATGAVNATGPLPDLGTATANPQTVGNVTFSGTGMLIGTQGVPGLTDWTTLNPGNDLALSIENLSAQFGAAILPVFSAGFDFVEPSAGTLLPPVTDTCNVAACLDSTFLVTLLNGATVVDSYMFNAANDVLAFSGVWSSVAFDRLQILDLSGSIDDEFFGPFYAGSTALPTGQSVPEPTPLVLLATGLAAVLLRLKRRQG